jgi:hypothetical protein
MILLHKTPLDLHYYWDMFRRFPGYCVKCSWHCFLQKNGKRNELNYKRTTDVSFKMRHIYVVVLLLLSLLVCLYPVHVIGRKSVLNDIFYDPLT